MIKGKDYLRHIRNVIEKCNVEGIWNRKTDKTEDSAKGSIRSDPECNPRIP